MKIIKTFYLLSIIILVIASCTNDDDTGIGTFSVYECEGVRNYRSNQLAFGDLAGHRNGDEFNNLKVGDSIYLQDRCYYFYSYAYSPAKHFLGCNGPRNVWYVISEVIKCE